MPYPQEAAAAARIARTLPGLSRRTVWMAVGVLAVLTLALVWLRREPTIPAGEVLPNVVARPMTPLEATATLREASETAEVTVSNGTVIVHLSAALYPEQRGGRLLYAQQYARADEMVSGQKRPISFLDPSGSRFAVADPVKGVYLTR